MKHRSSPLLVVVIVILLGLGAQSAARAQATAPPKTDSKVVPKAVLPFTTYDFGNVNKGETITYYFVIRNEGNTDLRITQADSGCGCEVISADPLIAPGKEGRAYVKIDTSSQTGSTQKLSVLHTNDPVRPTIVLSLSANVLTG